MGITSRCTECGSESSGTGGIVHATTCTMTLLSPQSGLDYLRPPAIELKFGSQAEQEKFMTNLSGTLEGNDLVTNYPDGKGTLVKSATPSDNLNKVVEELAKWAVLGKDTDYEKRDGSGVMGMIVTAQENKVKKITQAITTLINNEKIAWEQKPVGDAIEIDVPAKTMQFVMSKIKLKPKTIASRTLTPEWVVELWLNGKGDKYDLQVYIWKLKILASLTHRYNWAIFLLKPENLPTKATLKKGGRL